MRIPFVDLYAQYQTIKAEIDSAIQSVIQDSGFIGGKHVSNFENDFARFLDVNNCIGCANGTDAIQIVLKSMNIGKGDEVIVPANSFIATSEAVTAAGARVVFCEVLDDSNNLDPDDLEKKVTNKTKAVIAVHLYGRPADMDRIKEVSNKYKLKLIEDAAQAHAAEYKGKKIGTLADAACFSFYPGKNLGAYGDGGAITTNDDSLVKTMRMWSNHGRSEKYNHEFEGYNSRLDGVQAAILSAKLKHLGEWTEKRRAVAVKYSNGLSGIGDLILPNTENNIRSVYHLYVVKSARRDQLQSYLKEKDISTGIHYPIGLPFLKAYQYLNHDEKDFPVTAVNQHRVLSLPMFAELTDDQVDYVIDQIINFYKTN